MKFEKKGAQNISVWRTSALALHLFLLGLALIGSCSAEQDDPFAGVHTNASVRRTRGSYEQMESEREKVNELRSALGSSRYHGRPHWLPAYTTPAVKALAGGVVTGGLAAALPALTSGFPDHISSQVEQMPAAMRMAITGSLTVSLYQLAALIARRAAARKRQQKLEQFIALWPGYRHLASDEVKAIMNAVHKEFSSDGKASLPYKEYLRIHDLLAHTLAHQNRDLTRQINAIKREKRQAEKEKAQRIKQLKQGGGL